MFKGPLGPLCLTYDNSLFLVGCRNVQHAGHIGPLCLVPLNHLSIENLVVYKPSNPPNASPHERFCEEMRYAKSFSVVLCALLHTSVLVDALAVQKRVCGCPLDNFGDEGVETAYFPTFQCAYANGACTWNYFVSSHHIVTSS